MKARVNAKPGEEQTLFWYFKYLEDELGKITAVPRPNAAMSQNVADEVKSMLQDLEAHMPKNHDDKLSNVGAVMAQQHDLVDERIKGIQSEITMVKLAVAARGQAPLRAPPGYARPSRRAVPSST